MYCLLGGPCFHQEENRITINAFSHMSLLPRVYRDNPLLSTLLIFSTSEMEMKTVVYRRGRLKQFIDCFSQITAVIKVLHK